MHGNTRISYGGILKSWNNSNLKTDEHMTPNALATHLFSTYEQYRIFYLRPANCRHREIVAEMRELVSRGNELFSMNEIGKSVEGRSIYQMSFGRGQKKILLWSQMHGDESTATLGLMDVFNMLVEDQ